MAAISGVHPKSILADPRVAGTGVNTLLARTATGREYMEKIGALPTNTIHLDEPGPWSDIFRQMQDSQPGLESVGGMYVSFANTMALPPGALDDAEWASEVILHEGVHRLQRGTTPAYIGGRVKAGTIDFLTLPWKGAARAVKEVVVGEGSMGSRLGNGWDTQMRLRALRAEGEAYNVQKQYVAELYEQGIRTPEMGDGQMGFIDQLIQQESAAGRLLTDDDVTLAMPRGTIYDQKPAMHSFLAKASAVGQAGAGVAYLATQGDDE